MSYLQQYLNEIEAEAAEKSRLARANAALIELAGEVMARINACAERDAVYPCYHLTCSQSRGSSVTLQQYETVSNEELLDALDAAGFPVGQMPVRIAKDRFGRDVYLMVAPGVELLIKPRLTFSAGGPVADKLTEEDLPCAA